MVKYFLLLFLLALFFSISVVDATDISLPYHQNFNYIDSIFSGEYSILNQEQAPIRIEFTITPKMITDEKYIMVSGSSTQGYSRTVTRIDENARFNIKILNRNSGEVLGENGFGSIWGSSTDTQRMNILQPGPYDISISGKNVIADLSITTTATTARTNSVTISIPIETQIKQTITTSKITTNPPKINDVFRLQEIYELTSNASDIAAGQAFLQHGAVLGIEVNNPNGIYNNIEYSIKANEIYSADFQNYSSITDQGVQWVFPSTYEINQNNQRNVSLKTKKSYQIFNPVSMQRSVSKSIFFAEGLQYNKYTIQFKDLPYENIWGSIQTQDSDLISSTIMDNTFFTDAPLSSSMKTSISDRTEHRYDFYLDKNAIILNHPYTVRCIVKIKPKSNIQIPVEYYPKFLIGLSKMGINKQLSSGESPGKNNIPTIDLLNGFNQVSFKTNPPLDYYRVDYQMNIFFNESTDIANSPEYVSRSISEAETMIRENEIYGVGDAKDLLAQAREFYHEGNNTYAVISAITASEKARDIDGDSIPNDEDIMPALPNYLIYIAPIIILFGIILIVLIDMRRCKITPKIMIDKIDRDYQHSSDEDENDPQRITDLLKIKISIIVDKHNYRSLMWVLLVNDIPIRSETESGIFEESVKKEPVENRIRVELIIIKKRWGSLKVIENYE